MWLMAQSLTSGCWGSHSGFFPANWACHRIYYEMSWSKASVGPGSGHRAGVEL